MNRGGNILISGQTASGKSTMGRYLRTLDEGEKYPQWHEDDEIRGKNLLRMAEDYNSGKPFIHELHAQSLQAVPQRIADLNENLRELRLDNIPVPDLIIHMKIERDPEGRLKRTIDNIEKKASTQTYTDNELLRYTTRTKFITSVEGKLEISRHTREFLPLTTTKELKRTGYLDQPGIVVGRTSEAQWHTGKQEFNPINWKLRRAGRAVTVPASGDPGPTLVIGSAGSGNTVSVEIPTVMKYPHSMVILDCYGQIYESTRGHRSRIGTVLGLTLDPKIASASTQIGSIASNLRHLDETDDIVTYHLLYEPVNLETIRPVIKQLLAMISQRTNQEKPLLVMIPEFIRFGFDESDLPMIEASLSYYRNQRIQMMLGVNAISQLYRQFEHPQALLDRFENFIILNIQDPKDAEILKETYRCPLSVDEILRIPNEQMLFFSRKVGWYQGKRALPF
jgi:hypothetical protein